MARRCTKVFDSIDTSVLKEKLAKKIGDKKFLELLFKIVDVLPVGIPLGFPTSQWFANLYLTDFDHFVKEQLKTKYYVRFSDDMVIFSDNKIDLLEKRYAIMHYLTENLRLKVKKNHQIFPVDIATPSITGKPLDFLGFKHHRDFVVLRKKVLLRFDRKIRHVKRKGRINIKDARQLVTYAGYLKHAKCHKWYEHHVKPNINLRQLRAKISKYDKRHGTILHPISPTHQPTCPIPAYLNLQGREHTVEYRDGGGGHYKGKNKRASYLTIRQLNILIALLETVDGRDPTLCASLM